MPTDLPERKSPPPSDDSDRSSGKPVVILIVVWIAVMLAWAAYAGRTGLADAFYQNRHPNAPGPGAPP